MPPEGAGACNRPAGYRTSRLVMPAVTVFSVLSDGENEKAKRAFEKKKEGFT